MQQLQKEFAQHKQDFKHETEFLRSCVDSAEDDLEERNTEVFNLKKQLEAMKKKDASPESAVKITKLEVLNELFVPLVLMIKGLNKIKVV